MWQYQRHRTMCMYCINSHIYIAIDNQPFLLFYYGDHQIKMYPLSYSADHLHSPCVSMTTEVFEITSFH